MYELQLQTVRHEIMLISTSYMFMDFYEKKYLNKTTNFGKMLTLSQQKVTFGKVRHISRIESWLGCMQEALHVVLCTKKAPFCLPELAYRKLVV